MTDAISSEMQIVLLLRKHGHCELQYVGTDRDMNYMCGGHMISAVTLSRMYHKDMIDWDDNAPIAQANGRLVLTKEFCVSQ